MPAAIWRQIRSFAKRCKKSADTATSRTPFIFLTAKRGHADVRTGMSLGADDYLVKPVRATDLVEAIAARRERAQQQSGFNADFSSAAPLEKLGLSAREAEILLRVAQGKTNFETSIILDVAVTTVKKHLDNIFTKLGVESRNAATLKAPGGAEQRDGRLKRIRLFGDNMI